MLKQYLHLILSSSSDTIEKLLIFILMTGGNASQGHPVNEFPCLFIAYQHDDLNSGIAAETMT